MGSPRRIIVIGIDFGTSSIKVSLRDATNSRQPPTVVDFGTSIAGYNRFGLPAVAAIAGAQVAVGEEGERCRLKGLPSIASLKTLALTDEFDVATDFSEILGERLRRSISPGDAHEFAFCLLCGTALRSALNCVDHDSRETHVLLNMDVPLSQIDDPRAVRFRRVLRSASLLAPALGQGNTLKHFETWSESRASQESDSNLLSTTALVPEAEAIMAGLGGIIPQPEGVPHVVVDIGAGTTDVGVFRFCRWHKVDQIAFFSAGTENVGVDRLDNEICTSIDVRIDELLALKAILRQRQAELLGSEPFSCELRGRNVDIPLETRKRCIANIRASINGHYVRQWSAAYAKYPQQHNWDHLRVIAVGGGSLIKPLYDCLGDLPPRMTIVRRLERVGLQCLLTVNAGGATAVPPTSAELVFLAAALGLSYAEPQRRILIRPVEIEPFQPEELRASGDYAYEIDLYE